MGRPVFYCVSLLEDFVNRLLEVVNYRGGSFVAWTVVPAWTVVSTEVTALAAVFATLSTLTALTTRAAVIALVAVIAITTVSARPALRLDISLRLLYESPH